ncbi:MAG: VTT domain-containing protein [Pseudomonadales bacterium]|nr:VTT domain-containing protein [Pseudomonadales bacterium]
MIIEDNLVLGAIIFIGMFSLANLIQVPGLIFLAAAVLTLGKIQGGIITYVAAVSSCLVTYAIVGLVGHNTLRAVQNPIALKIFSRIDQAPISSIIMLRIIFQTAPILNYTLALSGLKFRHYLTGTLIGLPIPIFFYCLGFDLVIEYLLPASAVTKP